MANPGLKANFLKIGLDGQLLKRGRDYPSDIQAPPADRRVPEATEWLGLMPPMIGNEGGQTSTCARAKQHSVARPTLLGRSLGPVEHQQEAPQVVVELALA